MIFEASSFGLIERAEHQKAAAFGKFQHVLDNVFGSVFFDLLAR